MVASFRGRLQALGVASMDGRVVSSSRRSLLSIAVGGGKGGVGKSVLAANLACALAQRGLRVVMVDADLGSANLHSLFGIDQPGLTLQAFLDRRVDSLEEVVLATGIARVGLVPGSAAIPGAANLPHTQKLKLGRHIQQLDADVIIIDVGAGISFNVIDFFDLADLRLLIASPQLTSLQNTYSFLKAALYRSLRAQADSPRSLAFFESASDRRGTERLGDVIDRVGLDDPPFAGRLRRCVAGFGAYIVGNQLEHRGQVNVLHALSRMLRDFLGVEAPVTAALCVNKLMHQSVTRRRPYFADYPSDAEATVIAKLAELLLEVDVDALRRVRAGGAEEMPKRIQTQAQPPVTAPGPVVERTGHTPLPSPMQPFLRKHERYAVGWTAWVRLGFDMTQARIVDISLGGASVAVNKPLQTMDEIVLVIDSAGRPELNAKVKYVHMMEGRIGVEFVGDASRIQAEQLVRQAMAAGCQVASDPTTDVHDGYTQSAAQRGAT